MQAYNTSTNSGYIFVIIPEILVVFLPQRFDLDLKAVIFVKLSLQERIRLRYFFTDPPGGQNVHVCNLVSCILEPLRFYKAFFQQRIHKIIHPPKAHSHSPREIALRKGSVFCQFAKGLKL